MLHFFENGSFGLLERFPGLRRRLRITARCKAVCDGIVILRTAICGWPVTGPQRGDGTGRPPSIAKPPGRPLHTNRASVVGR
jgi:hypothetical protein